jgi:hypothetical protein
MNAKLALGKDQFKISIAYLAVSNESKKIHSELAIGIEKIEHHPK